LNKYIVYEHLFPNGKKYYGYTSRNLHDRFLKNGIGYKEQPLMWNAIQKYGWDNIQHNQICVVNSEEEAKRIETKLIRNNDTANPSCGYNIIECDGDRFGTRNLVVHQDGLHSLEEYNALISCDCIDNFSYYDFNSTITFDNIGEVYSYHRFITGDFAGMIYVDINIDKSTHLITEDEYKKLVKHSSFIKSIAYKYIINKSNLSYQTMLEENVKIMNDPVLLLYSLYDGSYKVINYNSAIRNEFMALMELLKTQKDIHESLINLFNVTKNYLSKDDLLMMRNIREQLRRLKKIKNDYFE
jgi:hypothetical protein